MSLCPVVICIVSQLIQTHNDNADFLTNARQLIAVVELVRLGDAVVIQYGWK